MSDPCDACTSYHFAAVEREIAEQEAEQERQERERDQAMEDYEREVREYRYRIIEYLAEWVAYDYQLHAKAGSAREPVREPVLVPAPIHPDDRPSEPAGPNEDIPY